MAHYRHLPVAPLFPLLSGFTVAVMPFTGIWKAALDLAVHLEHAVRRFPRYHKYTLGTELRQTAQRLCRLVARANDAKDAARAVALDELVGAVEEMKTLLTLAQEVKAFANFNEFAGAAELTVSLGKQSGGWRRRVRPEASTRRG
ncbi:MAG: four helix bundle protein [Gallionella sp.]|nr:four helix bundle protein [Gallionella sp.]